MFKKLFKRRTFLDDPEQMEQIEALERQMRKQNANNDIARGELYSTVQHKDGYMPGMSFEEALDRIKNNSL